MTLSLGSRTYSVEKTGDKHDLVTNSYVLTGQRGSRYILIRKKNQPEVMFSCAIDGKWPTQETPFKKSGVLFSDAGGQLHTFRR